MQASNRGKAFGALYLTGSLGGMFGSLYATNLGKAHVSYNILNVTTLANHCIHQLSVLGSASLQVLLRMTQRALPSTVSTVICNSCSHVSCKTPVVYLQATELLVCRVPFAPQDITLIG